MILPATPMHTISTRPHGVWVIFFWCTRRIRNICAAAAKTYVHISNLCANTPLSAHLECVCVDVGRKGGVDICVCVMLPAFRLQRWEYKHKNVSVSWLCAKRFRLKALPCDNKHVLFLCSSCSCFLALAIKLQVARLRFSTFSNFSLASF